MKLSYSITVHAPSNEDRNDVAAALENALDHVQEAIEEELDCKISVNYFPNDEDDDDNDEEGFDDE